MSVTVLVVDDASFVRDLIKRTLRQLMPQAEILEAQNGTRAQALIRQRKIDLILSDWEMPEMSGEELLIWTRQQESTVTVPFVMITSRGDRNHVIQAINAGVSDYLAKPFTADELIRKLLKQFKRMGVKVAPGKDPDARMAVSDSVGVLTGGSGSNGSPAATDENAEVLPGKTSKSVEGRATLRFATSSRVCNVREMSLQAIVGEIDRDDSVPALFESAVVDLESPGGETLARVNAYVHSLQSVLPQSDCSRIRLVLRFVDRDPAKLEALSRFLTKGSP